MPGKWIKVRSSDGGDFDCYVSVPDIGGQVPAVVLASAVHGVDTDIIAIADEFAARGFEVALRRGEQVVVRVAGEAAVAGVGLHRGQDRGELLVGGHVGPKVGHSLRE